MAELEIKVGADVASAISGLDKLQSELNQTGKAAAAFGNEAEKAGAKILKLPSTVNQATFTLNNFTRVVQDAPYGIRGVANNIDPLVESFTRLIAQTGSTTLAFRAMIGTLAGPAGILLAVSTITSALTYFGDKLFTTSQDGKEAYKELADAANRYKEVQNSLSQSTLQVQTIATGNVGGEIAQIQALLSVVKDQTLSYQQRNNALNELQKINKAYFGDLSLEKTSIEQLTQRINEYTQALISTEVVKLYKERVAAAVVSLNDQIEAERKLNAQLNAANIEREAATKAVLIQTKTDAERERGLTRLGKAEANVTALEGKLVEQGLKITKAQNAFSLFNKELKNAVTLSTQFKPLDPLKDIKTDGTKVKFDFRPIIGITNLSEEIAKQAGPVSGIVTEEYLKAIKKGFKDLKEVKIPFRLSLTPEAIEIGKGIEAAGKAFDAISDRLDQALQAALQQSIEGFGAAIGDAISGKDVGESIINVFSSLLGAIGKALIAWGIAKEGVDKILGPTGLAVPGTAAIGIGIATIAASTLLKNFGGARAEGGPVGSNKTYLVGERGPELFVPNVAGNIVPNDEIQSFSGGLASVLGGRMGSGGSILRGQDIILSYARTQRSQLRVNG